MENSSTSREEVRSSIPKHRCSRIPFRWRRSPGWATEDSNPSAAGNPGTDFMRRCAHVESSNAARVQAGHAQFCSLDRRANPLNVIVAETLRRYVWSKNLLRRPLARETAQETRRRLAEAQHINPKANPPGSPAQQRVTISSMR
ncbi:hypothetical protein NliqN6_3421 [Naganishia liquefaciens]|uniref:Uncharacterized protein n=1 Tax=Naganishia liquefaciens TaxID=104408 RepID=A0A8H3TVN4_9TREE|nr:hypothetical protein NliqN6_3421 [Naganishia liquefaciens]